MSATDELRRMLDESGVEWTVPDESWNQDSITYWKVGSIKWVAFESENGTLWLNCNSVTDLTPEQAIAATVHDEASTHKALIRESDARMALQRDYNNQIRRIQNQRKQLMEMQAALERGKCHMVLRHDYTVYGEAPCIWWECDECGCTLQNPFGMPEIHYCPNCGRRVVE